MNRKTQLRKSTGTAKLFRLPVCSRAIFGLFACIGMLAAAVPVAWADTGTLTTLYSFNNNGDGATPYGALVQDADGNFYGTTHGAIPGGKGTVFKLTPSGTLTTLHSFNGTDGANPEAGLVLGSDGNFYGTTSQGGTSATPSGTIFKITPTGTLTTLHMFCSTIDDGNCADGQIPTAALIQGSDGDFYGTTSVGGANNNGTVFKITAAGDFTLLYSFDFGRSGHPNAALVEGSDGNFYGTTVQGGLDLWGTVFKITPTGTYTRLHSFTGDADGESPSAALLLASDGNFYGTTGSGGVNGNGTAFKITPSGTLTTLHAFDGTDGRDLSSGLIEGSDGNFYGTAYGGGAHGDGDIYRMTPDGTVTVLHSFAATDGQAPLGTLLETQDGSFYGTTFGGGPNALTQITYGTVFKFSGVIAGAPPAPGSLSAIPGNASVTLTWTASSGATSYNVYQGTSAGGEAAKPVKTGITDTNATVTGLSNGTAYYFTVAAVNDSGISAYSNEASATPLAIPGQVTGLTASPADRSAKLAWTAVSGATGYTIEQGTSAGKEKPVATGVTATTYTASGLSNGTKYFFKVAATNSAGSGPVSDEVSTTPASGKTATPTFNPVGGSYKAAQSVTLSDTTTGATIYYTTDGSTPTTDSTRYNAPISVSATETIKAIAASSGNQNSAVATATYTIKKRNTKSGGGGGASSPVLLLLMLALVFLGRRRWLGSR
ncbi:MAG: choice-of-anchor tandem repeat GloVer-containing protein [Gammaproteobacteria bacterium]